MRKLFFFFISSSGDENYYIEKNGKKKEWQKNRFCKIILAVFDEFFLLCVQKKKTIGKCALFLFANSFWLSKKKKNNLFYHVASFLFPHWHL
jgi:hypothetical protein